MMYFLTFSLHNYNFYFCPNVSYNNPSATPATHCASPTSPFNAIFTNSSTIIKLLLNNSENYLKKITFS
jgi:hypothetical protein